MERLRLEIYSMFLNINKGYEFFKAFIADLPLFEKSKTNLVHLINVEF